MHTEVTKIAGYRALEIKHPKYKGGSQPILIVDCSDNIDIDNTSDSNLNKGTLLNVCYTACKYVKQPLCFIYVVADRYTFDKRWEVLAKAMPWKGVIFHDSGVAHHLLTLCEGLNRPFSERVLNFFKSEGLLCTISVPLFGTLGKFEKGGGGPNILGFVLKSYVQIATEPFYSLEPMVVPKIRIIDTIDRFNKAFAHIENTKIVSVDIETNGLNRVTSSLLSVQFGLSNNLAYCLPMDGHSESPWDKKDLSYIKSTLNKYFSTSYSIHLMQYGIFDVGQLCHHFNIKYYNPNIYDIISGENVLEENLKFLNKKNVYSPYSLESIELRYGLVRPQGLISKDQRNNMASFSMKEIAEYGSYDVTSLFDIKERQEQACTHSLFGFKSVQSFNRVVLKQLSPTIKVIATMQNKGMKIDVGYLLNLVSDSGPLTQEKMKILNELYSFKSVQKLNKRLLKEKGLGNNTLFGGESDRLFDINKPSHKKALFFDVLELEPVNYGKAIDENGDPVPSADKEFQKTYAPQNEMGQFLPSAIPEVACLVKYSKVSKLKAAFADAIMKRIITDQDFISDKRLRSSYGFVQVLGGRCVHEDTLVSVVDARMTVKIKYLKVGDWVWSVNSKNMKAEPKRVTQVFNNGVKPTISLYYSVDGVTASVTCTSAHKIWSYDTYIEASLLKKSDLLRTLRRDKKAKVLRVEQAIEANVYDIEVEDNHNFFANGILVHNCNSYSINMQQIPSRGPLSKIIKSAFIAERGKVIIGSDFSAHEVRVGGIIAKDTAVKKLFETANEAIREFRLKTILSDEELNEAKKLLEKKGDIHLINVNRFFGLEVDKKHPLRDQVKAIVFGVLYGKMAKNLAKSLGIEVEEAEALLDKLFTNWSGVKKWIDSSHESASKTFMYHYPNERIRHLWGYLSADEWVHFAMNRRAINSPVQGFASDLGVIGIDQLNMWINNHIWKKNLMFDFNTINMIHDAQYSETEFKYLPLAIYLTEHAMSTMPMDYYKKEFNYEINIPLSYDIDFGKTWSSLKEWDKRSDSLFKMIESLGNDLGKETSSVLKDAKTIMGLRERELRENPYKMLITPNNSFNFFTSLDMFKR